jgi:hypothetical protein
VPVFRMLAERLLFEQLELALALVLIAELVIRRRRITF